MVKEEKGEMYMQLLRGFTYHSTVVEDGDCVMKEPNFVRCIKTYMEEKIIKEMADGMKFSRQRSAETIGEEKVIQYREECEKSMPRHGKLWDEISSDVKKKIGQRDEAREAELRTEAIEEVDGLWETAKDDLLKKLIGPHVTSFARQFFVAMNGPKEQAISWPLFVRGMEERLCQFNIDRLMQLYMLLWGVHDFQAIKIEELYRCAEFPLTLWRILIKLGLANYDDDAAERQIKELQQAYNVNKDQVKAKEKERNHMREINAMYRAIRDMVDDGTRTSMYNPMAIEEIGDPEEDPKLVDWQDSVDASSIFRVLCRKAIGNKSMTDIDGARRFLCLKEVQHILQRTAWFPFNVSSKIGMTAAETKTPDIEVKVHRKKIEEEAKQEVEEAMEPDYKREKEWWINELKSCPVEKQDEMKDKFEKWEEKKEQDTKKAIKRAQKEAVEERWNEKWLSEENLGSLTICVLDDDFEDFKTCFYAPDEGTEIAINEGYMNIGISMKTSVAKEDPENDPDDLDLDLDLDVDFDDRRSGEGRLSVGDGTTGGGMNTLVEDEEGVERKLHDVTEDEAEAAMEERNTWEGTEGSSEVSSEEVLPHSQEGRSCMPGIFSFFGPKTSSESPTPATKDVDSTKPGEAMWDSIDTKGVATGDRIIAAKAYLSEALMDDPEADALDGPRGEEDAAKEAPIAEAGSATTPAQASTLSFNNATEAEQEPVLEEGASDEDLEETPREPLPEGPLPTFGKAS